MLYHHSCPDVLRLMVNRSPLDPAGNVASPTTNEQSCKSGCIPAPLPVENLLWKHYDRRPIREA